MINYHVTKRPRSRYMKIQMLKVNELEVFLKAAKEKKKNIIQGIQVRCTVDFSAESMHLLQDILNDRETLSANYNYI